MTDDDLMPNPTVWAQCSECGTDYVMRRWWSLSKGWIWLWAIDCKHKKAEAIPVNADGPVNVPMVQS